VTVGRRGLTGRLAHALPELVWLNDDLRAGLERSPLVRRPLRGLAKFQRRRLDRVLFVAVTGSAAKSTTKELIAAVLGSALTGTKTRGNANTPMGVARTLLRTSPEHDFSVLELGTDAPGKLQPVIDLVRPRIGVVTTVGLEHLEHYDSVASLAAEKATLVQALPADGVAVLNSDDPNVLAMGERCAGRVVTVGLNPSATLRAEEVEASWPARLSFTVRHGRSKVQVRTRLCGRHWVQPVLASLAVGLEAGVPLPDAARAVESVRSFSGRMEPVECADEVTFIRDDAKHDLLTALRALDFLEDARAARKVVVFGRIGDFEGDPYEAYSALTERALAVADEVIFTGVESTYAPEPKDRRLRILATVKEASEYLRETTRPGDVVLLRGSRRSHLDRIILAHNGEVACWLATCGRRRFCDGCQLVDLRSGPDDPLPSRLLPRRPQPLFPVQ
jgi:UDP-N-acetylmuramoyl-tripeptide--D-alanyl-D-alanine ligase